MTVQNLIKQLTEFDPQSEAVMWVEYPSGDPELVGVKASRHRPSIETTDADLVLINTDT